MYITANSMWLTGKPDEIITTLRALAEEYTFVDQVLHARLH